MFESQPSSVNVKVLLRSFTAKLDSMTYVSNTLDEKLENLADDFERIAGELDRMLGQSKEATAKKPDLWRLSVKKQAGW